MSISHLYLRSQLRCSFLQETCPNRPWRKASLLSWAPKVWSLPFSTYHFLHFMLTCVLAPLWVLCGEGNGTPLQYSCLENPMDGGARWAAVHGVAKSRTSLSLFTFMHWRRKQQPTPVFLPGESQRWGSLVGCCLWGCTESDTTHVT